MQDNKLYLIAKLKFIRNLFIFRNCFGFRISSSFCSLSQGLLSVAYLVHLGCVSFRKSKIGFLNPKESENGFCVSLLNRSLNPRSFGSWCIKGTEESTSSVDSSVPLTHHDPRYLGLICLVKKRKIRFQILSDLRIQSWIFLKKRTLSYNPFQ